MKMLLVIASLLLSYGSLSAQEFVVVNKCTVSKGQFVVVNKTTSVGTTLRTTSGETIRWNGTAYEYVGETATITAPQYLPTYSIPQSFDSSACPGGRCPGNSRTPFPRITFPAK